MDFTVLRQKMINEQIVARGINDSKVIQAMRDVPRHEFVLPNDVSHAYSDYPIPIGEQQTISQPYMVALMSQALELKGSEKVLEIGTGSGYQAAILAKICSEIYSIERIPSLAHSAEERFKKLHYDNIKVIIGDGTLGLDTYAPFDVIIVTAAAPSALNNLLEQLKDNGRMVVPIGNRLSQILTLFKKDKDQIQKKELCNCVFVPLVGKEGW